ncbi:MAG: AMP-binding protein [Oscillospiraceae bacterium]|nr:AMP-binding protein [Oscillospiraceae bacterium]
MMLLKKFLPRIEFDSYEDFKQNYTVNIPENFNFGFDVVDAWAESDRDKPALLWCDDHGNERSFTFDEISRLSNQAVHFFRSHGIRKGDAVMLILRRRWEYWVCATALMKMGAVLIPASMLLTAKDIVYRVQAAGVKMLVCVDDPFVTAQTELAAASASFARVLVAGRRDGWLDFAAGLACQREDFPRPVGADATRNDDLMMMYFTSGTTGLPKMAMHDHTHPLGHIVTAHYWQRVAEGKLHMTVSDSGWAKFGWGKIYGQWICGAVIFAYDMDKFVPSLLLEKLQHYPIHTFCAPPTMFRFMLQEENLASFDLSSIQHCGNAGEPLNPEIFRRWFDLTGIRMTEGFGQTESTVLIANFEWFAPRPGSMGKPSPLYDIDLVDAKGDTCGEGEEGEIVVRHINDYLPTGLFTGYFRDEETTAKAMAGGDYHTGDVAWRDADGYYWFVGRNDDVIKCSGYRIGPFEVESALLEHPSVVECAITAVSDPIRGQVVKATVVLAKGYTGAPELVRELQDHVKKVTAPYKYPRVVEFVDELPKTVGGKIKRAQIRKADEERSQ